MEARDVSILIAVSLMMCPTIVICQNCGYRRFFLAEDRDYFPSENTIQVIPAPDVFVCAESCYRNRRCIAVGFDQSSHQCHMFSRYRTRTTGGTRISGVKYLTLESMCGPSDSSLSWECERDDVITTSQVTCDETKTFKGTNDTVYCTPPSTSWTSPGGDCVDNGIPLRFSGEFMQTAYSKLTVVGTPVGDSFSVTLLDGNKNYLLKIGVKLNLERITRNSFIDGVWQRVENSLDSPFSFILNKTFTMEIVSTLTEFECTVDGLVVFTYKHRLPRESINSIKFTEDIKLLKLLTT